MNYISATQFLRQSKQVQDVFIKWWEPQYGDLFSWIKPSVAIEGYMQNGCSLQILDADNISSLHSGNFEETCSNYNSCKDYYIPLLTETQLREFIEYKTECKVEFDCCEGRGYTLYLYSFKQGKREYKYSPISNLGFSLFEAYFQVACQIAEGNLK